MNKSFNGLNTEAPLDHGGKQPSLRKALGVDAIVAFEDSIFGSVIACAGDFAVAQALGDISDPVPINMGSIEGRESV